MRVLLVDDDSYLRVLVGMALPEAELREAWRVEQAYHVAIAYQPDAIVVDQRLPDGDGLDFIRRARYSPELRDIPILLLTAGHEEIHRLSVLEAGADDYLSKLREVEDLRGIQARLERLVGMTAEERATRRAGLAERLRAGEYGDLDQPVLAEPEPAPQERRRRGDRGRDRDREKAAAPVAAEPVRERRRRRWWWPFRLRRARSS